MRRLLALTAAAAVLLLGLAGPASADLSYSPEALPVTLHCGAQTIQVIKPTGTTFNFVAQTSEGTGVFQFVLVTVTATGEVLFSPRANALEELAATHDLVTSPSSGPSAVGTLPWSASSHLPADSAKRRSRTRLT